MVVRFLADGLIVVIAVVSMYVLLRYVTNKHRYQVYGRVLMAGLTSYFAAKLAALIFQPTGERPFELMGTHPGALYLNNPGFPSDHALLAVFLAMTVFWVTRSPKLGGIMALLALGVCAGRVLALVHTPLDVIAGAALACVGCIWYLRARQGTSASSLSAKS